MNARRTRKDPEIVMRGGKPTAVILSIEEYRKLLERVEDAEDLKTLRAMRKRPLSFRKLGAAGLCATDEAALKFVTRSANKPTAIIDGDPVTVSALSKPQGGLALGAVTVPGESGYNRGSLSGDGR